MNKEIVEKFFINQTTPEETERVLKWFETPGGKKYLQNRLDADAGLMDRRELREMVPELDSENLYRSIRHQISKKENVFSIKQTDRLGYIVKAAAAVLVIITASVFTIIQERQAAEEFAAQEPVIFQAEEGQHREITLGDGTEVRLNSNSEMIVSRDFMQGAREITLYGEAYFDVEHNPEQPFIVHANQSSIEVLGTAFNVRSVAGQDNVQVAVVEGSVSFFDTSRENDEQLSVILSKGQYGFMNINEQSIEVDNLAVENYLAWKSGQFIFEDLTLQQVCTQLNRIYSVQCNFEDEGINSLYLTSNFSSESLDKTLEVIALSLDLEFEKEEFIVHWSHESQSNS